jgi:hypothetical protein
MLFETRRKCGLCGSEEMGTLPRFDVRERASTGCLSCYTALDEVVSGCNWYVNGSAVDKDAYENAVRATYPQLVKPS